MCPWFDSWRHHIKTLQKQGFLFLIFLDSYLRFIKQDAMLISILQDLFNRDLNLLKFEISAYKHEADLWLIEKNIKNSGGNLCLHLIGNLNAYIGAELGNTGYIRQRELEFSLKNVPKEELIVRIDDTRDIVNEVFSDLNSNDLNKEYPIMVFKREMTTGYFLVHLATHLTYHLGQINYHRRLMG